MNTIERQQSNIDFFVNQYGAEVETFEDLKILTFSKEIKGEEKPMYAIFKGRSAKTTAHYYCHNEAQRQQSIENYKQRAKERAEYKAEKAAKRAAFVPTADVGDVFHCSWGYDQTNNDFYQVTEKLSKHYVMVQPISQEEVRQTGPDSCTVKCVPNSFHGEAFRAKVGGTISGSESIKVRGYDWAFKLSDVTQEFHDSWGR